MEARVRRHLPLAITQPDAFACHAYNFHLGDGRIDASSDDLNLYSATNRQKVWCIS